ncbi:MAG: cytochrome P450 [Povalibacter sp.]
MATTPRTRAFDSTLALLRDPYRFISRECRRAGSDVIRARLLMQETVLMTGAAAAQLFCDNARFARSGAAPLRLQKTLFGVGGVQSLDDAEHRTRKSMFMDLMTTERVLELQREVTQGALTAAQHWTQSDSTCLYDAMQEVLTRAVCAWSGVPLHASETRERTRQLAALFDGAGAVGPKHWISRLARKHSEQWIAGVIERIRKGEIRPAVETAAHRIAWHRSTRGELLEPRIAAVELLNVLRPTVAVSVYVVFIAHALYKVPHVAERLRNADAHYERAFVQEIRRWYPFFPAVVARVRERFEWRDHAFEKNERVMLDLYGIDHDPRVWHDPESFSPERFASREITPFNFAPQGPGDHLLNHRCPGEWITMAIMQTMVEVLLRRISYSVPLQDASLDYARMPALPRSRFVISGVRVH